MSRIIASLRTGLAGAALLTVFAVPALAQQPQPLRIRGVIESADGAVLTVKTREGEDRKVRLADKTIVAGVSKITVADIKPGSYIGVTGMPQADGTQKAIAIHIFPESQRGTGEGFRPWDLRPNSTMTNATVAQKVASSDGETIKVTYKGGEKTVKITPETQVVSLVPGERSELKVGAKVLIFSATKAADGSLETNRISVGRDGITPPM